MVTGSVMVLAGKPAIRFQNCPDVDRVYRRLQNLGQTILRLDAAAAPVEAGRCRICGCTMTRACPSGCWWADASETICLQHGSSSAGLDEEA